MLVNRTPVTAEVTARPQPGKNKGLAVFGCGLSRLFSDADPRKGSFDVTLHITTPYMPITSDGKAPDLEPFVGEIAEVLGKAMRKARRNAPKNTDERLTQKQIVLDNLDAAVEQVSGSGTYRFNERQVLYVLRPIVMEELGKELSRNNFADIIADYENEHGEIEGMYREPRGSIYHPHSGEVIPLGTLNVEDYERPAWLFHKVVYIEKEGFAEALKADRWAERHDAMVMSSKGTTTRAAKDLVDQLAEHDEPVTVFCVHDADAAGGMIYQTFQKATKARQARKIRIVNLGLEPWEAVEMGLQSETVKESDRKKPVADYIEGHTTSAPDGTTWAEWLQSNRVELNAMTTPQFIAWLDSKMAQHGAGKLVPPQEVVAAELEERVEAKLRRAITDRILREADVERLVAEALERVGRPTGEALVEGITAMFTGEQHRPWRDHVEDVADELTAAEAEE